MRSAFSIEREGGVGGIKNAKCKISKTDFEYKERARRSASVIQERYSSEIFDNSSPSLIYPPNTLTKE